MLKSKVLKDDRRYKERIGLDEFLFSIKYFILDRIYDLTRPFRYLKKLYDWHSNVFKYDFDFDGHSLFRIMGYKLLRLETSLENGNSVQCPKDMRALKLAIKLAKKISRYDYGERLYRKHESKWGELRIWSTPIEGSTRSIMHSSRPNANTPEEIEQERKEIIETSILEVKLVERDRKRLYGILDKYLNSWWD